MSEVDNLDTQSDVSVENSSENTEQDYVKLTKKQLEDLISERANNAFTSRSNDLKKSLEDLKKEFASSKKEKQEKLSAEQQIEQLRAELKAKDVQTHKANLNSKLDSILRSNNVMEHYLSAVKALLHADGLVGFDDDGDFYFGDNQDLTNGLSAWLKTNKQYLAPVDKKGSEQNNKFKKGIPENESLEELLSRQMNS